MVEQITITKGPTLDEAIVQKFKAGFRGELISPGDAGYDEARKIWNGMIDKHPALIARCTGAVDVINAVNFALANKQLVAVRGGGHNVAGNAVCDGGIVIDLSRMKGIRVDPVRRIARANPVLRGLNSTGRPRHSVLHCRAAYSPRLALLVLLLAVVLVTYHESMV